VYPESLRPREWLASYAARMPTVELNTTFYRLPTAEAVRGWAQAAPPGFVFAVKLGAFGSHRMKLRDADRWLPNHVERFRALGDALGPNLVQLPPRWKRNAERLDEFLSVAPKQWRWALEVRDASWLDDDTFMVLQRHGVALCIHDLLADHPRLMTTTWTYVRFHGPDALTHRYLGPYGTRRLRAWAMWIADRLAEGRDVYAYFNNDYHGHAFRDAQRLRRLLDAGDTYAGKAVRRASGGSSSSS
jgi:uncharacterized protein YecE (DUF72 family)